MLRIFATFFLFALLSAAAAQPPTAAASNMPPDFYPRSPCIKPDKSGLGGAPGIQDQQAMLAYNLKVKAYNQKAAAFGICMKTYVDNAQNDIAHIQDVVHAAVAEANQH